MSVVITIILPSGIYMYKMRYIEKKLITLLSSLVMIHDHWPSIFAPKIKTSYNLQIKLNCVKIWDDSSHWVRRQCLDQILHNHSFTPRKTLQRNKSFFFNSKLATENNNLWQKTTDFRFSFNHVVCLISCVKIKYIIH